MIRIEIDWTIDAKMVRRLEIEARLKQLEFIEQIERIDAVGIENFFKGIKQKCRRLALAA